MQGEVDDGERAVARREPVGDRDDVPGQRAVRRSEEIAGEYVGDQPVHRGRGHEQQDHRDDQLRSPVDALHQHRDLEQVRGTPGVRPFHRYLGSSVPPRVRVRYRAGPENCTSVSATPIRQRPIGPATSVASRSWRRRWRPLGR